MAVIVSVALVGGDGFDDYGMVCKSSSAYLSRTFRGIYFAISFHRLCNTDRVSVIFLSVPIGAGKTAVAKALLPLLPAPLSYIEGDTFWSFIRKDEQRGVRDNFPVVVRSMTAAAIPFARSGFRVLIDFSIPPTYLDTARKILKEVPFDYVVLHPSLALCARRAAEREEGRIEYHKALEEFHAMFGGTANAISDDAASPEELAARIHADLIAGVFAVK